MPACDSHTQHPLKGRNPSEALSYQHFLEAAFTFFICLFFSFYPFIMETSTWGRRLVHFAVDLRFTPVLFVTRRNIWTRERQAGSFPLCSLKSNFNLGSVVEGWGGQKMGPIRGDTVSLQINVLSGTLSEMHLTFHTNSRGRWKPCLATHIFSLSVSLCCSLRPNWSSWSDNPALSALISSQACLSVTDWSQMALLRGDNACSYQTGRQQHANLKPWTRNHAEHPGNGSVMLKR